MLTREINGCRPWFSEMVIGLGIVNNPHLELWNWEIGRFPVLPKPVVLGLIYKCNSLSFTEPPCFPLFSCYAVWFGVSHSVECSRKAVIDVCVPSLGSG